MKTNYIRMFAIFASILMLTIVAVPMVAAEDDYESCFDATEICDETHVEIKELFTKLDIAIANYNQASKDGLHTYEYAEEIDTILKKFESYGAEIEELLLLDVVIPYENEELCKEIIELIYKLEETIVTYNEAIKQGDIEIQAEYFKKIGELVSELQALGMNIEITGNLVITITILGKAIVVSVTKKTVISYLSKFVAGSLTSNGFIWLLESRGADICQCCERWIRWSGKTLSYIWGKIIAKYTTSTLAQIFSTTPWRLVGCMIGLTARIVPACNNPNCAFHRHR